MSSQLSDMKSRFEYRNRIINFVISLFHQYQGFKKDRINRQLSYRLDTFGNIFFNITIDSEIKQNSYNKAINQLKTKWKYIKCSEFGGKQIKNIVLGFFLSDEKMKAHFNKNGTVKDNKLETNGYFFGKMI